MRKCGFLLMVGAMWLAVIGIFWSEPSGQMPDKLNLFRFALHGLEVQLFRTAADPPRYLVNVLAREWLLGCLLLFAAGAALVMVARRRQRA
ncbi:hypothetical protein [Cupriavidus agavae]|uniref:Transmembrane protein n=1 Tax=Cupriavidus agavae TaxID=1001822 RepID=A0A4Q7RT31_9BURK|nr:hypothetical protein [Cupriavidus agavae]RZT36811.1 hypothetical protein EV147_3475 [Cupriavidus agavae]